MNVETLSAAELHKRLECGEAIAVVDVRTPLEFERDARACGGEYPSGSDVEGNAGGGLR